MKVYITKAFGKYKVGVTEVSEARGNYLSRIGVAQKLGEFVPGEDYGSGLELVNLPEGINEQPEGTPFISTMPMISSGPELTKAPTKKATPKKSATKKDK